MSIGPDDKKFPHPAYAAAVLDPLFRITRQHFAEPLSRVDRAHCVMLNEAGILDRTGARGILQALKGVHEQDVPSMRYTGEFEDLFFCIENALKIRLGVDLAGRLHTGRSRNDIDHTVFKLVLKARIDAFADSARGLASAILDKARAERNTLIVAYTHGQPAQPTTYGHYLCAALEVLLRDLDRLEAARAIVDMSPMGAAAITTTGFPIDRGRVAELLGFGGVLRNSYGCIASVDYVTSTYSALKLMVLHLGRLVQDLQQWTSFEVGQIRMPDSLVQISSIMPQKRNPVPIEHLRLLLSLAAGRAETILGVMHNTPFTDMNDSEGEVQNAGYGAFAAGGRALALLAALIPAVSVDGERVALNIDRSCITITELADEIVRREGLSFRQAHEIAAHVARAVADRHTSLREDGYPVFAEAFQEHAGRASGVTPEAFRDIVSAEHFVAVRDRFGGPADRALDEALDAYQHEIHRLAAAAGQHAESERAARRTLDAAVDDICAEQKFGSP